MDMLDLLDRLGVALSANSDAMTADDAANEGEQSGFDVIKILNTIVKNLVLAARPWDVDTSLNRIDYLGVFVRSNFVNELLSMLLNTTIESANSVLDETQSGIFLYPSSDTFAKYGYDQMLALRLAVALANKKDPIKDDSGNEKQYTWSLDLGLDAKINLESIDTYETLLDIDDRLDFISLDDYLGNILALVNGFYKDSYQKETTLADGTVYYTFAQDPAGEYVMKSGMFRKLNDGESTEGATLYSRSYATVAGGVGYALTYVEDPAGDYVFDETKDVYVRKDAYTGASTTYYRREERAIKKVVAGVETEENEELANLNFYSKNGVPQYQDQNVSLSVSGLIYFNSNSAQSVNAGGLISNLFGDMIINLQALSAFNAGIGLRVSANVDLAALDLAGLLGGGSLSDFTVSVKDSDCEKVVSPVKGADFAIQVTGDSMAPEYPSGSVILIKKINESAFIEWGKAYVLDTENGSVVKKGVPSDKEGCIRCVSINPDPSFAPFDVPLSSVFGIYRVLMCMSMK